MSLQPFTQPTRDEYQTWPMIRVRSAWSGGWGSPMARVMMPSITAPICCWHSMAATSGEASEAKTAATSWGWRPMARSARSRTSTTRSDATDPRGGTWARRSSSCSTQKTRAAARRWSLEEK